MMVPVIKLYPFIPGVKIMAAVVAEIKSCIRILGKFLFLSDPV